MTSHLSPPETPETIHRARFLRRTQSDSEALLWNRLRGKRLDGIRFRRQHPFGPYTLDFYAPGRRLVVELDGQQHDERTLEDAHRDLLLSSAGIVTVRVSTADLYGNLQAVLEKIALVARGR